MFTLVAYFFDLINQLKSYKIKKQSIHLHSPTKKLKLNKIKITHVSVSLEPKVKYNVEKEQNVFRPCEITPKSILERMLIYPFICAS